MSRSMHRDPAFGRRPGRRTRMILKWAAACGLAFAIGLPGPTLGQTRSGTDSESSESQPPVQALAAKKPKKMRQAKREKIKNAKYRKALEYESLPGGVEELVSTTDFDSSGNARARKHEPGNGSTAEETLEVDLERDVVTKVRVKSSVVVDTGGGPQTLEDNTETDFAYEEVDFEDGKDHLLKTLDMKRNGSPVAKLDHTYDVNGRLHRLVQNQADETGQPTVKRATTEFTYDASDRPVMIVTYDHRPGDLNPTGDRVIARQKREYGANGQVSRIENLVPDLRGLPPGTDSLLSYSEYTYDSNLNLLTLKTWQRIAGESGPQDVLVSEERHVYDGENEIETTVVLPVPPPPGPPDPNGLPPSAFEAARTRRTTRTFDGFGNVLTELTVETDPDGTERSRRNRRIDYERFD